MVTVSGVPVISPMPETEIPDLGFSFMAPPDSLSLPGDAGWTIASSLVEEGISTRIWSYPPTSDPNPLGAEQFRLTITMACLEVAPSTDDPPPGKTFGLAQDVPHGSGCTRISGFLGDFAVGDHVSRLQGVEYPENLVLESGHKVPKSRSPMSPRPGRM
jgi:hypothetical protein